MIVLSQTTDKIQVVLDGNVTTNQLQCYASWRDRSSTTFAAGRSGAATNNTTDVDLVGSPDSGKQRLIDYLSIYNADTVKAWVTVKLDANGTEFILMKQYLSPGQTLVYAEGYGWNLTDIYRPLLIIPLHADMGANFAMTNATQAERFAGNTTRHFTKADLTGYNQVRLQTVVVVGSASVNTPLFRVRYHTEWPATIGVASQLGASAQVEVSVVNTGYLDTGWMDLAAGAKGDIFIVPSELGGDGAADPALGGTYLIFR